MNKRLEEKLAMLAFGDLSPEETTRLEREVAGDREAGLVLEEYRGMRSGLKAMGEIPEHQLSTDRLRHAILNQGLKPKSRPQLGWLWMPAMAAVLTFGIVMVRNANRMMLPSIDKAPVALGDHNDTIVSSSHQDAFAFATASGQILSVAQTKPTPNAVLTVNTTSTRRHRDDRTRIEDLKARVSAEFDNLLSADTTPVVRTLDTGSKESGKSPAAAPAVPIILIDTAKDSSTGAQKAKEVDSTSNVAVGG